MPGRGGRKFVGDWLGIAPSIRSISNWTGGNKYALNVNDLCCELGEVLKCYVYPRPEHHEYLVIRDVILLLLDWHAPNVKNLWYRP